MNILAQVDPGWLENQVRPEWLDRYGQRFSDFQLPKAKENRLANRFTKGSSAGSRDNTERQHHFQAKATHKNSPVETLYELP